VEKVLNGLKNSIVITILEVINMRCQTEKLKASANVSTRLLIQTSIMLIMAALVAVATLIIRIPNPMGGYFNVGDVMIFVTALTFNPIIGGFAGGVGSAIADAIGFPPFVIPTLIIKGLEGLLAGIITNRKNVSRDILAVAIAGSEMITGYFLAELYVLQWGLGGALAEVPTNIAQIVIGGLVGIPVARGVRKRLPEIVTEQFFKEL
jgi:uncharacterized membrane protein